MDEMWSVVFVIYFLKNDIAFTQKVKKYEAAHLYKKIM